MENQEIVLEIKKDDIGEEIEKCIDNKKTYTEAHKISQQKYRKKYPEKYCELQRKIYEKNKNDEEWRKKFNERSRINNAKYREKKKQEKLENPDIVVKKRGRPRKVIFE